VSSAGMGVIVADREAASIDDLERGAFLAGDPRAPFLFDFSRLIAGTTPPPRDSPRSSRSCVRIGDANEVNGSGHLGWLIVVTQRRSFL
jgi:hypothetical protein